MTFCISSTDSAANHSKNSASSRSPSVEYVLHFILEFLITCSISFADSSFARSAIQRHFGSILKNEKLKNVLASDMVSVFAKPYLTIIQNLTNLDEDLT